MENAQAVLVGLQSATGIGAKTLWSILEAARDNGVPLSEVPDMNSEALREQLKVTGRIAAAIEASDWETAASTWQRLAAIGTQVVTILDDAYPSRLVNQLDRDAPPMLYVKGNTDLLNVPGIGFSGSRKASEAGLAHTTQLVQQSVERGMMVISGHAGGVDAVAHKAAVDAGGQTALAIPEGILKFQMRAELREAYDESPELFVVVSEFLPGIPWSGRNAMARNRIILGMSDVTCIIEAGTSGGTWNAGVTALKLNIPSFVLQYDNPPDSAEGNIRLIERGAIPIPADETGIQLPGIMPTVDKPIQPGLFDHDTNND